MALASASASAPPAPPSGSSSSSKRARLLLRKLGAMEYALPDREAAAFGSSPPSPAVLSLVEALFTDLVTTTEAYEGLVQKEESLADELRRAQASVFPLRKENTQLVRENNQLHLELIKGEDALAKAEQKAEQEGKQMGGRVREADFRTRQKEEALEKARKEVRVEEDFGGRTGGSCGGRIGGRIWRKNRRKKRRKK